MIKALKSLDLVLNLGLTISELCDPGNFFNISVFSSIKWGEVIALCFAWKLNEKTSLKHFTQCMEHNKCQQMNIIMIIKCSETESRVFGDS